MDYTYQFEDHLREHRPSRVGQRLWSIPAAAGVGLVIADTVYLAATPAGRLSHALAVAPPFIAAFLVLVGWAALSIAEWTYPREKFYREAQHVAASQLRAYVLAGRRSRAGAPPPDYDQPADDDIAIHAMDLRGDAPAETASAPVATNRFHGGA